MLKEISQSAYSGLSTPMLLGYTSNENVFALKIIFTVCFSAVNIKRHIDDFNLLSCIDVLRNEIQNLLNTYDINVIACTITSCPISKL